MQLIHRLILIFSYLVNTLAYNIAICELIHQTTIHNIFSEWSCILNKAQTNPCQWRGLTCSPDGNITSISLAGIRLSGIIPSSIGLLVYLSNLDLSNNYISSSLPTSLVLNTNLLSINLYSNGLTGPIPASVGQLMKLQNLNVAGNLFSSTIPSTIGDLKSLSFLDASYNYLTGELPSSLGFLPNLNFFILRYNFIDSSIPSSFCKISSLRYLNIQQNWIFSSIPSCIGRLTNLQVLNMNNNFLSSSIPASIGNLRNLIQLAIYYNSLTSSVPSSIGSLNSLIYLLALSNRLTGTIPTATGQLQSVKYIDFSYNSLFSSIPSSLCLLFSLTALNLQNNQLYSSIPPCTGRLTNLQILIVNFNSLSSSIPSSIGNLTKLTLLSIDSNQFTSSIPTSLGRLNKLIELYADTNKFTSTIPTTLANMMELQYIDLGVNSLSGVIPSSFFTNTNLISIGINRCKLSSSLSPSMCALSHLQALELEHNALTSSLPSCLFLLKNLTTLDLLYNRLTSSLPSTLGLLPNVQNLLFNGNRFTSTIPTSISHMDSLTALLLASNAFTGPIPTTLFTNGHLSVLALNSNQFSSSIPDLFQNIPELNLLDISSNNVTSTLPSSLGSLIQLQYLNLSYNQLFGPVHSALGQMSSLTGLTLEGNSLSGSLPTELAMLSSISSLCISRNRLTSTLPSALGTLRTLNHFVMHSNRLTGSIPPELFFATNIIDLELYSNRLTSSLPTTIALLVQASVIVVAYNSLTSSIPTQLCTLTNLGALYLGNNYLTSTIPTCIGELTTLTTLVLSVNSFTSSIPSALMALTGLQSLYIDTNLLISSIPAEIGYLQSLTLLNLTANRLSSSIPSTVGYLSKLICLAIDGNLLTGSLPVAAKAVGQLVQLSLSRNRLSGSIPSFVILLSAIEIMKLEGNRFTGVPPEDLCTITSLKILYLMGNNLLCAPRCQSDGDWAPAPILPRCRDGQDQALYDLNTNLKASTLLSNVVVSADSVLYNTSTRVKRIYGPNAFKYKLHLDLYQSDFPRQCEQLYRICRDSECHDVLYTFTVLNSPIVFTDESVYFVVNPLCTSQWKYFLHLTIWSYQTPLWSFLDYPPYLSPMNKSSSVVYALGLCQNNWTGITCENGLVVSVQLRALGDTSGKLPTSIGSLVGLTYLDLGCNDISGPIPASIGLLSNINRLDLTTNKLTGTLPNLSNLTKLVYATVANNQLQGSLPMSLLRLTGLQVLYMDGNQFAGEVDPAYCTFVVSRNLSFTLFSNPGITCYRRECWESVRPDMRQAIFGPGKTYCAPTQSPTFSPTLAPTRPSLTVNKMDIVYYCLGVLGAVILAVVIYLSCFSKRAVARIRRRARLRQLPLHKVLLEGSSFNSEQLLDFCRVFMNTVLETDYDGHTAMDIIFEGICKTSLSPEILYELLLYTLEVHEGQEVLRRIPVPEQRYFHIYGVGQVTSSMNSRAESLYQRVRNVGSGGEDKINPFSNWTRAIQSEDAIMVQAIELLLKRHRDKGPLLADALDDKGRRCRDIASPACKVLLLKALYLHERYELSEGPAVHRSATSLVVFAKDHGLFETVVDEYGGVGEVTREQGCQVALKFMLNQEQYQREVRMRMDGEFDSRYVVPLLHHYDEFEEDWDPEGVVEDGDGALFRRDAERKGFQLYPYCIVMEAATENLKKVIDSQHFAGNDWPELRKMVRQLLHCVEHIHHKNIVHGDLKPLNVLMVGNTLKLIDLDGAANFSKRDLAGGKVSSAFVPPEMVMLLPDGNAVVRGEGLVTAEERITAEPAQDMWSLGCILYLMFTGSTLFQCTVEGNMSVEDDLLALLEWRDSYKAKKLACVQDTLARNLLSLLITKNPKKRISASRALSHPFITGRPATRLQGEAESWDVFLSHREGCDDDVVKRIYKVLVEMGLRVWWDLECSIPDSGLSHEECNCKGLVGSAYVVCVMSRESLRNPIIQSQNLESLSPLSACDNLLLLWRFALELKDRGMVKGIFPIMIGDRLPDGQYSNYFKSGCNPNAADVVVESVEECLMSHLEREGLGGPYRSGESVRSVLSQVLSNQGGFLEGDPKDAIQTLCHSVHSMVNVINSTRASINVAIAGDEDVVKLKLKIDEICESEDTASILRELKELVKRRL